MLTNAAERYIPMMKCFLGGQWTEREFMRTYLYFFKNDDRSLYLSKDEVRHIEQVFFAIEDYHWEPQLSEISREEFEAQVGEALKGLQDLEERSSEDDVLVKQHVQISLSNAEAVVFLELTKRFSETSRLSVQDEAESHVLLNMSDDLQLLLRRSLGREHTDLVEDARAIIRAAEDSTH